MKILLNFLHTLAASHYALVDSLIENGVINESKYRSKISKLKKDMETVMKIISEDDEAKEKFVKFAESQNGSREA